MTIFAKGNRIRITQADNAAAGTTVRTIYRTTDEGFYDTHGTFWPVADNDVWSYTCEN